MSDPKSVLDENAYTRIFQEEVVPGSRFLSAASQEHPKAIILAGQPGAGKGSLKRAAEQELGWNVVPIDPDELRDHAHGVDEFRKQHPYTWSGDTHPFASRAANDLRELAVSQKKNIIVDTTLGHGDSAVNTVKALQEAGYEVEVRAVVAHRLESELGIDKRFSELFDERGYGRHVPAEYHGKVYEALPNNLDRVRNETTAPVRLFSREGLELYDSRTDVRMPGTAMAEERVTRMQDPLITRNTHRGLDGQVRWHDELPNTIQQNPKVSPEAAQNLFAQRAEGSIAENIRQSASQVAEADHHARVHPARMQGARALGAAGLAASAYDAGSTHHRHSQLQDQDNPRAAQAEALRFAASNAGGWGGAIGGAAIGAAAGVESGPGLLLTGAIGGIAGAVAGDKIAEWITEREINHQQDRDGNTWTFDPQRPEQGWTREVSDPNDIGPNARLTNPGAELPAFRGHRIQAEETLPDELSFKAACAMVEMAVASSPPIQYPYKLPIETKDRNPDYVHEAPHWQRNPNTGEWTRQVATGQAGPDKHMQFKTETASPARTEELNSQSQAILAANTQKMPATMATEFQREYEHRGWSQYGPMPTAVQNALEHPGRIVGQDKELYERNAQGQWVHDRFLLPDTQAGGSLHEALEATYQARQNALRPVTNLESVQVRPSPEQRQEMNPPAPASQAHEPSPETEPRRHDAPSISTPQVSATPARQWPSYQPPTDLRHPDHPGHYSYQRALEETHRMESSQGIKSGPHSEKIAAATATTMLEHKMPSLSRMEPGEGNQIHGIQQNPERRIAIDTDAALSKTVEQHSQQWLAARSPHYVSNAPAIQRTREDEETLERLSPQNQALFCRAREGAPTHISDATVVQGVLTANRQGIDTADKMGNVSIFNDQLLIQGKTPGYRAMVNVTESAPSLQESVAQVASLDRQREQERQQEQERQLTQQKEQNDPIRGALKMA